MSKLSTHVLDTSRGRPAADVAIVLDRLERLDADAWSRAGAGRTDDDGRLRLSVDGRDALPAGVYRLTFETGAYFAATGTATFFPSVTITFEVAIADQHHHVPLLLAPFGYSTYRGS